MAIQASTVEKYEKAIRSLFLSLSRKEFREYSIGKLCKEYGLFPGVGIILHDLKWITSVKGKGSAKKYRIERKYESIDPKDIIVVIKACNSYSKPKNKINKVVPVTGIFSVLNDLVKEAEGLEPSTVKIIYRNKKNYSDYFTMLEFPKMFAKNTDFSEYEEHKIPYSPRSLYISKLTEGNPLTVANIKTAEAFAQIVVNLSKEDSINGFKARVKIASGKLAKCTSNLEKVQLIDDLCKLYITYKHKPGNRFVHIERYKTLVRSN